MGEATEEFEKMYEDALNECGEPFLRIVAGREVVSCRGSESRKVYVLCDEQGRKSVLKQFSIDQAERLRTEHAILSGADGEGLPSAGEYYEEGGWAYLTREYVEGMNLAELVALRGKLSVREAADIGMKVCDILTGLHSRQPQIIHRDIKPENIIYTPDKRVVLIDFDIARTYDASARNDTVYLGTRTTAPPEQFGYGQTDQRSDIYSLGVVLIYLCTASYDIKNLDSLPKKYADVCSKCTDFAPDGRYRSAAELKRQLQRIKAGTVRRAAIIIAAAAACALLIWGGYAIGKAMAPKQVQTAQAEEAEPTAAPTAVPVYDENGGYIFTSSAVEEYVRTELGIKDKEPVTENDLLSITQIYVFGDRIFGEHPETYWQDGHEMIDGEQIGYASFDGMEDIVRMRNLRQLILNRVDVTDASPIAALVKLEQLSLKETDVSDISCLAPLVRLQQLSITNTYVEDISVIRNWPRLNNLDMNGCLCADYSPLADVPYFEFLDISGDYALSAMPYIEGKVVRTLKLNNSHLSDISPFFMVDGLTDLHAQHNALTSIEGIEQLSLVTYIDITGNPGITDYSPLGGMPLLEYFAWDKNESTALIDPVIEGAQFKLNMID